MTAKAKKSTALDQQNKADRDKLLHSIFTRQAKAIDELLANTPAGKLKASTIQAVTQFLRLSDVSAATIADEGTNARETQELSDLVRSLDADSEALAKKEAKTLEAGGTLKSVTDTGPARHEMHVSDPFKKA